MRGLLVAACSLALSCATARSESMPSGDSRLDEQAESSAAARKPHDDGRCASDAVGDVAVLDARSGGTVACAEVTVSMSPEACPPEAQCATEIVYRGPTNRRGQLRVGRPLARVRLDVVSEGFGAGRLSGVSLPQKAGAVEVELPPEEGFWLKVLDGEGNYLQDLLLTFRQGDEVLAQLRSNVLANVFFTRSPFSGDAVKVEAEGFQPLTLAGAAELGGDGHTLTLKRR